MSIETYRDKRTAAAAKYRLECLNAKGEVECSECGMAVPEPRANRNAQELAREKIRKNDEGPICNACASSWRYSHHQDAEVEMANANCSDCGCDLDSHSARGHCDKCGKTCGTDKQIKNTQDAEVELANEKVSLEQKEIEDAASWIRARKWKSEHDAIQAAIDEADFSSQAATKAAGMVARSNPRAFENAQTDSITAEDPNLVNGKMRCSCGGTIEKVGDDEYECDDCGQRYERDDWSTGGADNPSKLKAMNNAAFVYVGDEVKVKDDPGLWIVMDYDGATYTIKGNNGIKKVTAAQIMRNASAGYAYSCEACGHAYNDHKNPDDRSSQAVGPCSKCSCDQYKPRSGKSVVENASDFRTSKEKRAAAAEAYRLENAYGCGVCGEKGHVYDVNGDKQILCEKHAAEAGGVLLSNEASVKYFKCPTCSEVDGTTAKTMDCSTCGVSMKRVSDDEGTRSIRGYSKPSSKKVHG